MGEAATAAALAIGVLAAAVFAVLAVATVRAPAALPRGLGRRPPHPVRHTFIATLPIG
jgi:tellurite resistance protein